jgi:HEAT repeat protein
MNADLRSLVAQLEGTDSDGQVAAATKLATLGRDAQSAAVALVRTVGIPHEEVLEACTAALEDLGPPAADQIEQLGALAQDCSSDVAYWAVTLLGRAGDGAAVAVPQLIRVLQSDADLPVRERAAWALGEIGPTARAAQPALAAAAESGDARLARLAKKALEAIGG